MNGLNVLPLTPSIKNGELINALGSNSFAMGTESEGFAALLENLLQLNQEKEEGQTEEELWNSLALGLGIKGLLLNNPAGKEANSGLFKGHETDQSVTNVLWGIKEGLNQPINTMGQFVQRLAHEGLQTGMKQASPGNGDIPQTELDRYKLEIIKRLQDLNGKLELTSKPSQTATVMQEIAAAKVYTNEIFTHGLQRDLSKGVHVPDAPTTSITSTNQTVSQATVAPLVTTAISAPAINSMTEEKSRISNQVIIQTENHDKISTINQNHSLDISENDPLHNTKQVNPINNPLINSTVSQKSDKENFSLAPQIVKGHAKPRPESGKNETYSNINENQDRDDPSLFVKENEGIRTPSIINAEKGSTPSLVRQITQALHRQTDGLSLTPSLHHLRQVDKVEIQLNPAELGKIHVSVRLEDGQVHLLMQATENSTGSLLQHQLGELRQTLINIGVACGNFEMGLGEGQDNSQGFQHHRHFEEAKYGRSEISDEPVSKEFEGYNEGMYGGTQVNVTA